MDRTPLPSGLTRRGRTYAVQYHDGTSWRRKAVGTDLELALDAHARLRAGTAHPSLSRPGASLRECIDRWLEYQRLRGKPRTFRSARLRATCLLNHLGDRPVKELARRDLDRFIEARRRDGVKDLTINNDLRVLKALLRYAEAEGLISELPCKVKLLRCVTRKSVDVFTPPELERVLEAANDKVRLLLTIAASTGLRLDELLHLRWRDIDLREQRIDVTAKRYERQRRDGSVADEYWSPKSHAERSVFITAEVVSELRQFQLKVKRSGDSDWVFQGRRAGERWTSPAKAIRKAFQSAGLYEPGKLTHALRHTVATRMLQNGTDLETVRDVLGHAEITTTAHYLHAVDERKRRAAEAVGLLRRRG